MGRYDKDWSWNPPDDYVKGRAATKKKLKRGKKLRKANASPDFYSSQEWLEVRYKVLSQYGASCMLCNATRFDGVKLHVDHILPRSKHPDLALDFYNLQVLCEHCNVGKSNKDDQDFRPKDEG